MTAPESSRVALLTALTERQSRSVIFLLAGMCRHSREIRDWLCDDFARNAKTRENFGALVDQGNAADSAGGNDFAELAGEAASWHEERRQMREKLTPSGPRIFGGLTWAEIEKLIRRYEAGSIDVTVMFLIREWRQAGPAAASSPRLVRTAALFLDEVIRKGDKRLLGQMAKVLATKTDAGSRTRRDAVGYSDWWKLHALLYMLRHPSESYRTREVRAHLSSLGVAISSLDFRRFCKRHGIRRDMRAGRPRKRASPSERDRHHEKQRGARGDAG